MYIRDWGLVEQAFPHAEIFPPWVKREATKAERGRQSCQYMFLLFHGTVHNGKDFCSLAVVQVWFPRFFYNNRAAFALQMCFDAFNKEADLDVLDHPVLNFLYYLVSTISAKSAKLSFSSVCIEIICCSLVTPNWYWDDLLSLSSPPAACRNSSFSTCPVHTEEDPCKATAIAVSPPQQRLEGRRCHLVSWNRGGRCGVIPMQERAHCITPVQ